MNRTYWVDRVCPKTDAPELPCEIAQIFDYGVPTPHLMCLPHGEVVGCVIEAGESD